MKDFSYKMSSQTFLNYEQLCSIFHVRDQNRENSRDTEELDLVLEQNCSEDLEKSTAVKQDFCKT